MGAKRAELVEAGLGSFTFRVECLTKKPRYFRVPFGTLLRSRFGRRDRVVASVYGSRESARVAFADGGRKTELSSLAYDYDLAAYQLEGAPPLRDRAEPREERVEDVAVADTIPPPPPSAPVQESGLALATLSFDGDELEVVELDGEGWVSFPSLLRPFGKRADNVKPLYEGWARTVLWRDPARKGLPGYQRSLLIHADDAPLAVARLDQRGMPDEVKVKHARYLREVAGVLAAYFTRGVAVNPRVVAAPDAWAAIQAIAGGALQLRQAVDETRVTAESAKTIAVEAKSVAEQARAIANSRSVLETVAAGTPPGRSSATPDGAWSAKPRPGYLSMRGLAREFALPSDGAGQGFVGRVARALGIQDDPDAVDRQDVVIGGRARREHITYGPLARERLAKPLRVAHATMVAHGYIVTFGVMCPAGVTSAKRSKAYVLREMLDAAATAAAPPRAEPPRQATLPGTGVH